MTPVIGGRPGLFVGVLGLLAAAEAGAVVGGGDTSVLLVLLVAEA